MNKNVSFNLDLPEWFHRRYPVGQNLVAKLRDGHTISVLVSKLESKGAVLEVISTEGSATEHDIIGLHLEGLTRDGYIHISPNDLMLALNVFKPVQPLLLKESERFPHLSPATNKAVIELAKQEGHRFGCHPFTVIRALRGFYGNDRILNGLLTALSERHTKPFTTEEDAIELMAIHDKEKHYTDSSRFPYPCYKDEEEQKA